MFRLSTQKFFHFLFKSLKLVFFDFFNSSKVCVLYTKKTEVKIFCALKRAKNHNYHIFFNETLKMFTQSKNILNVIFEGKELFFILLFIQLFQGRILIFKNRAKKNE
jgi:hypothetical protein